MRSVRAFRRRDHPGSPATDHVSARLPVRPFVRRTFLGCRSVCKPSRPDSTSREFRRTRHRVVGHSRLQLSCRERCMKPPRTVPALSARVRPSGSRRRTEASISRKPSIRRTLVADDRKPDRVCAASISRSSPVSDDVHRNAITLVFRFSFCQRVGRRRRTRWLQTAWKSFRDRLNYDRPSFRRIQS